ncbi:MAG: S-adenosylmethionine:tRNA ribosyltransferase-isomerase [Anaerolineae bacterium]|nr:S-adenosylmethionine:tRNA ribosyltransferase-isomerase [Anaerolineae bacterium]
MNRSDLTFDRPAGLEATRPPEARGLKRDEVRLLVSTPDGHHHTRFYLLPDFLRPGDVVVVNRSATLPASLPTAGHIGSFTLSLSTHYGKNLWLAEPRWSPSQPGPLPLQADDWIEAVGICGRLITTYPGLPRLWFIQFEADLTPAMLHQGQPIRYGYLDGDYPLAAYQTIFADQPGSAEGPSAGFPFTQRVVKGLENRGIEIAKITLHTGVSSLEVELDDVDEHPLYPEPFSVPDATAHLVNMAKKDKRRIIAVGTTVVRALESAWNGHEIRPMQGFTRRYIRPETGVHVVDGLITGLHEPMTTHLAMLYAIAGQRVIREAYAEAVSAGYLWHEFGDSHLILR